MDAESVFESEFGRLDAVPVRGWESMWDRRRYRRDWGSDFVYERCKVHMRPFGMHPREIVSVQVSESLLEGALSD